MTPERYARIKSIFAEACRRSGDERTAYLERATAGDDELRAEVEQLLAHDLTGSLPGDNLPNAAAVLSGSSLLPGDLQATLPERIGPYRIVRQIGAGGMGVVYEAEQSNPQRSIALKMIRPGLAGEAVLRRFEFEAHVLARLQHPGIAQVYEAGTHTVGSGPEPARQPYFAMEFVRGEPLVEYCANQRLPRARRLGLLADVCDAVHHAHQKGVIHRDLKPGNILVNEHGRPKVLDFGVARVTDGDVHVTQQTDVGQLVGTLPYMSPEQVDGDPRLLDTRSDVYALGVIGYELLSGHLPHEVRMGAIASAVRTIREDDPRRLGTLDRSLKGDLELIIDRALAKDREQRYGSAAEFAADLRRYLADEPVTARPPSTLYQLRKFARRNRGLVTGLACAAAVLVAGTAISTWQAVRATRAEAAATTAAAEATTVSDFLVTIFDHATPAATQGFDRGLMRVLLDEAALRIEDDFAGQPSIRATLHGVLGRVYASLSEHADAEQHVQTALDLRATLPPRQRDPREGLALRGTLADIRVAEGRYEDAEALYREIVDACTALHGPDHADTLAARYRLAGTLFRQGRQQEAEAEHAATLARMRATLGENDPAIADALNGLGLLRNEAGDFEQAAKLFQEAYERWTAIAGPDNPAALTAFRNLVWAHRDLGLYEQAEQETRDLLARSTEVFGPEHFDTIQARINLGSMLLAQHKYAEAEETLRAAYTASRQRFGSRNPVTLKAMNNLAITLRRLERFEDAAELFVTAIDLSREVHGPEHRDTRSLLSNYTGLLYNLERFDEAAKILREVIALDEKAYGPDHFSVLRGRHNLALLLLDQGNAIESAEILTDVLTRTDANAPPGHPFRSEVRRTYGDALRQLERFDEAEPLLLAAHEGLVEAYGEDHVRPNEAVRALMLLYEDWGDPQEADRWRDRLR